MGYYPTREGSIQITSGGVIFILDRLQPRCSQKACDEEDTHGHTGITQPKTEGRLSLTKNRNLPHPATALAL